MPGQPRLLLHTDRPETALAVLAQAHPDVAITTCATYEGLAGAIEACGAEVVYSVRFAGNVGFPRSVLVESGSVRWVSVGGSGTDHLQPWDPRHVTITNAAGVAAGMMAEYAIGAMLTFSLGLRDFARQQQARQWRRGSVEPIAGKTLLILGLGHTGEALATRARALGLATLGVRARPRPTAGVDEVHGIEALPGLWSRADIICCCVPLLASTCGLVGPAAFAAMKPGAILVDVSRGGVVDEAALVEALGAGRIRGAALDVFATEPLPPDNPLWGFDNVIVTPHSSSVYEGWEARAVEMFAENLSRWRRGEPLTNVVDPARGY